MSPEMKQIYANFTTTVWKKNTRFVIKSKNRLDYKT